MFALFEATPDEENVEPFHLWPTNKGVPQSILPLSGVICQRMTAGADLGLLIELFIDGIGTGLILALLGLGITLVFGLGGILNLAIGVFSMIAILTVIEVMEVVHSIAVAILFAMIFVGMLGLLLDRTLLPFVYRSEGEQRILVGIFTTLGLAIFLEGLIVLRYSDFYSIHVPGLGPTFVGGLLVRGSSIATIAISVVAFVFLYAFFDRTYVGQATRTVMDDEVGATLCGIDTRRLRTLVFVLSAMVAAIAGIMFSFSGELPVSASFELTIEAVLVSVVGGVRSIVGTVVAGLLLGIVTTMATAFLGPTMSAISLFAAAVAVLVIKPKEIE